MHVWLVKFEEDLPVDKHYYPYRMTMLADALLARGHSVVRWASDFDHKRKIHRYGCRYTFSVSEKFDIELMPSGFGYSDSHSPFRIVSIYIQSIALAVSMIKSRKKPNVIVVAMPAPFTCLVTAMLAKFWNVPIYIDARDMWPDILLDELGGWRRIVALPLKFLMSIELKLASQWAHGLIGITEPFRDFLLNAAGRPVSAYDAVFPIGFLERSSQVMEGLEQDYWNAKGVEFSADIKIIYFAGTLNKTVLNEAPKVATALRELTEEGVSFTAVFCGSGNAEVELQELFEDNANVIFAGHVSGNHLLFLKERSAIGLLPIECRKDYVNSLSNKFFDYLSGGIPIVTCLSGLPQATLERGRAGFFYSTSEQLKDILLSLITDECLLAEYSKNARKMFEREFEGGYVYGCYAEHLERTAKQHSI